MYFFDQSPEPAPHYEDMPPWDPDDNFDNVRKRTINSAWDALMTRELKDVSFRELSRASRVTPQAIYHHFKNLDELGAELAVLSSIKLKQECNAALRGTKSVTRYIRAFLAFALKRPNHFALITAPRFNTNRDQERARRDVFDELNIVLYRLLRREPTAEESTAMRIQVLGGAAMVAAKQATVNEVLTTLVAALKSWRRTRVRHH